MATSNVLTEFLCEDCVGKNLGIASAGAAGLKELMRVLHSSGDNASLPILGLCHSLRPEWKHAFKWLTSGSKDPTAEVIE